MIVSKKFIRRYQGPILAISVGIASILGLAFGVVPLAKKTMIVYSRYQTLSTEVNVLDQKSAVLSSLDEDALRTSLTTALSAVPQDAAVASVLTTVDGISARSGVTAGDLTLTHPGLVSTESAKRKTAQERLLGASILEFSFLASGTFEQIQSFLTTVGVVRRYVSVRQVDMTKTTTGFTARLTMEAYYAPLPTTVGAIAQPISPLSDKEQEQIATLSKQELFSSPADTGAATMPIGKQDLFSP